MRSCRSPLQPRETLAIDARTQEYRKELRAGWGELIYYIVFILSVCDLLSAEMHQSALKVYTMYLTFKGSIAPGFETI